MGVGFGEGNFGDGGYGSFQYELTADAASAAATGQTSAFSWQHRLKITAEAVATAVQVAAVLRGLRVPAGAVALDAAAIDGARYRRTYRAAAIASAFGVVGPNVRLRGRRRVPAQESTLSLTQDPAALRAARRIAAQSQSYVSAAPTVRTLHSFRVAVDAQIATIDTFDVTMPIIVLIRLQGQGFSMSAGAFTLYAAYDYAFVGQAVTLAQSMMTPLGWVVDKGQGDIWTEPADPLGSWAETSEGANAGWH